jgi:hypothetical protein
MYICTFVFMYVRNSEFLELIFVRECGFYESAHEFLSGKNLD